MNSNKKNNTAATQRRVAKSLPLMLVTSATVVGITGCGESESTNNLSSIRDEYKNIEECKQDWGSADSCQPQQMPANSNSIATTGHTSSSNFYPGRYFGPSYYQGQREVTQRTYLGKNFTGTHSQLSDHAISRSVTRSVSRGGFGSSSRGFSGGG